MRKTTTVQLADGDSVELSNASFPVVGTPVISGWSEGSKVSIPLHRIELIIWAPPQ